MFKEIQSFDEFLKLKAEQTALLAYFSTEACNVCKVLKPKVEELIRTEFPKVKLVYIKSDLLPEVAAQKSGIYRSNHFNFFDGREYIRKSRNIGISELKQEITRPYSMAF